MARLFVRPDVIMRTGIPLPFSISTFRPNAQIMPTFRRAYAQTSGNGLGMPSVGTAAATDTPVLSVILNEVRSMQGRPQVIKTVAKASVQDALSALFRGRTR